MKNFLMYSSGVFWIVVCYFQLTASNEGQRESCALPAGIGACVPLSACAPYLLLLNGPMTFVQGLQLTQARRCGFEGNNEKVCCPVAEPATTTSEPTPPPDEFFVDSFPVPGECGFSRALPEPDIPIIAGGLPVSSHSYGYQAPTLRSPVIAGGLPVTSYQPDYPTARPMRQRFPVIAGGRPVAPHTTGYSREVPMNPGYQDLPIGPPAGSTEPGYPSAAPMGPVGSPGIANGIPVASNRPGYTTASPMSPAGYPGVGYGLPVASYRPGYPNVGSFGEKYPDQASRYPMPPYFQGFHDGNSTLPPYNQIPQSPVAGGHYVDPFADRDWVPAISGGKPVENEDPLSISGGQLVDTQDLAIWMALLGYRGAAVFWQCGGSIITARHVLTAAHCIKRSLYVVRVGELDYANEGSSDPRDILVKKAIPHEQYTKYHNDVAILVLQDAIKFSEYAHIKPICLPASPRDKVVGRLQKATKGVITGWGETDKPGERPTGLLYAVVNIHNNEQCVRTFGGRNVTIDTRVICAGDAANRRDACSGDSGGPLLTTTFSAEVNRAVYYQLGIVSFGFPCKKGLYTGVYSNVTHYMPWIEKHVLGRAGDWAD